MIVAARTAFRLGLGSVIAVQVYRAKRRYGVFEHLQKIRPFCEGDYFFEARVGENQHDSDFNGAIVEKLVNGDMVYFGACEYHVGSPPNWFLNPISGQSVTQPGVHWSRCSDFDTGAGDIKGVWEASRFYWAVEFARAYRSSGDAAYLNYLNRWIEDWASINPLYQGPNWLCAQEASIRLLNILLAAELIGSSEHPSALVELVEAHCERIYATMSYARAQKNNHGTSEAAALFVAGAWLRRTVDTGGARGRAGKYNRRGRTYLEQLVRQLFGTDGSFCQYSVNYHRVALDTLSLVEWWRRQFGLEEFSPEVLSRASKATELLYELVNERTGRAPNLGANDSACLTPLNTTISSDFRPSVQLASALFLARRAYASSKLDRTLTNLGLAVPTIAMQSRGSQAFPAGGVTVLRERDRDVRGIVHLPSYKFRPSHADALHFDFWMDGINLLRDSGSYSYAASEPWLSYFPGTSAHNTIQFDDRDQMPRIGRFLFGHWLKRRAFSGINSAEGGTSWAGEYIDWRGCRHRRAVHVNDDDGSWLITDEFGGYANSAVLRWHLIPERWVLDNMTLRSRLASITISAKSTPVRIELLDVWQSDSYLSKSVAPVLEVEFAAGVDTIETSIEICSLSEPLAP